MTNLDSQQFPYFFFKLYISGITPKSSLAIRNLKKLGDSYLKGHYSFEIIDASRSNSPQVSEEMSQYQITFFPTLIKVLPLPVKKFIGDISNTEQVLAVLDLHVQDQSND